MNEPACWRDDDDDFRSGQLLNDEERRELEALRRQRDTFIWLLENANPEAWAIGIANGHKDSTQRKSVHTFFYHVRMAMPRREATSEQRAELERLVRLTRDPASWEEALSQALTDAKWYLRAYRKFALELGVDPDAQGAI